MNASFILLGLTMAAGSFIMYSRFKKSVTNGVGFGMMGIAGIGTILVGIFPENTNSILHVVGAALPFLIGNLGILILGVTLDASKSLKLYSLITGLAALTALALFLTHTYLGLGIGGMERMTAYPQTVWLVIVGSSVLVRRRQV